MQGIDDGRFDALVFVGHHSSAVAEGGILSHTFVGAFTDLRLNAQSQSETSLNALLAAHFGVPAVFNSGDDAYIADCLERLPGMETVVTKNACGFTAADSLEPAVAQRLIAQGVERGVRRRGEIPLPALPADFDLEIDFTGRVQPEMWSWLPWCERRRARTIGWRLSSMPEVMQVVAFTAFYQSHGLPRYGEGTP